MGDDMFFDYKYSMLLTILCTCMSYSSSMPVLYLVAAFFFFIDYWCNKIFLLRIHRKPDNYDDFIAKSSIKWYRFAIILHIIGFLLMYGYTPILQDDIF